MMKPLGLLLATLALALGAQAQQIYKWVDAQGRTHYGEKPVDGTPATTIAPPTPPSSPATTNNPEQWKEMERDLRQRRLDREFNEEAQRNQVSAGQKKQNCEEARKQLRVLETQQPVFQRDSKGDRIYLPDDKRETELAKWKQRYQENCN
jgi:hypothetical protein